MMKKKVTLIAMVGLFCMIILTGCTHYVPSEPETSTDSSTGVTDDDPSPACCVVIEYLTEQEALGIILSQLEEVGLNFNEPLQSYSVQINGSTAELVLINEDKDLRIAFVHRSWLSTEVGRLEFTESAVSQLEAEFDMLIDVIFFNPVDTVDDGEWQELRADFERDLISQVQTFIEQLREEGIID